MLTRKKRRRVHSECNRMCLMLVSCVWCWYHMFDFDIVCLMFISCVRCWYHVFRTDMTKWLGVRCSDSIFLFTCGCIQQRTKFEDENDCSCLHLQSFQREPYVWYILSPNTFPRRAYFQSKELRAHEIKMCKSGESNRLKATTTTTKLKRKERKKNKNTSAWFKLTFGFLLHI